MVVFAHFADYILFVPALGFIFWLLLGRVRERLRERRNARGPGGPSGR